MPQVDKLEVHSSLPALTHDDYDGDVGDDEDADDDADDDDDDDDDRITSLSPRPLNLNSKPIIIISV